MPRNLLSWITKQSQKRRTQKPNNASILFQWAHGSSGCINRLLQRSSRNTDTGHSSLGMSYASPGKNAQMLQHKELNREALTRCNCLEIELSSWPISTQVRKTGLPMPKRKIDVVLWPKMRINQATTNVSRERRTAWNRSEHLQH